MTFLFDTHTLIWATSSRKLLSITTQLIVEDPDSEILVSAASAWEIASKVRLGKLPEVVPLERDFLNLVDRAGYTLLPVSVADALRSGRLPGPHRDPFDRILAAQALTLDIPILSLIPSSTPSAFAASGRLLHTAIADTIETAELQEQPAMSELQKSTDATSLVTVGAWEREVWVVEVSECVGNQLDCCRSSSKKRLTPQAGFDDA